MRLPTRRTRWLSGLLLIVIVVGFWLLADRSRITEASFYRIQREMSEEEVKAILGDGEQIIQETDNRSFGVRTKRKWVRWSNGANFFDIKLTNDKVDYKYIHLATTWETISWFAKQGAAKFGVKWD